MTDSNYASLREAIPHSSRFENKVVLIRAGKMNILHSNFVSGERYMRQMLEDIMVIATKVGNSYIFVPITCDHNRTEIQRHLAEGHTEKSCPDIVSRLF